LRGEKIIPINIQDSRFLRAGIKLFRIRSGFRSSTRLLGRKFILFGLKNVQLGSMTLLFSSFLFIIMLFNQQQCFIYSTASFLSKLRAKKVEKLRILVIKQLQQMTAYRKFRKWNTGYIYVLADLNPCTTCTMYISLTIFLIRSGIAFYFHLFSTVQVTVRPNKNMCVYGHMSKKFRADIDKLVNIRVSTYIHICYMLFNQQQCFIKGVSEWLLFSANSAIFQLYHGENKLIFNEMMMRFFYY
jgi:hypothetical protein